MVNICEQLNSGHIEDVSNYKGKLVEIGTTGGNKCNIPLYNVVKKAKKENIITSGSALLPTDFTSPAECCDATLLTLWLDLETSCGACAAG